MPGVRIRAESENRLRARVCKQLVQDSEIKSKECSTRLANALVDSGFLRLIHSVLKLFTGFVIAALMD